MSYPMRRISLPTVKIEETIRFYQDVFGMTVFYDQVMEPVPGTESLLGPEGLKPHRIVSLQQGNSVTGMMGLIDYMQPELGIKPFVKEENGPFPVVVVFLVEDIEAVAQKVRKTGYRIVGGPSSFEIPGVGTGAGMSFVDPNGVLVELTQLPKKDPQLTEPISSIRRVTVPVVKGTMDKTVAFYEKVFGLKVYYDDVVVSEPDKSLLDLPGVVRTRLVSLQSNDERFGMVGLIEYLEPDVQWQGFSKKKGYPYEVIFVFLVDDMNDVITKATAEGGKLLARKLYEIPQRGMVDGAMLEDPNGVVIDLTQMLG